MPTLNNGVDVVDNSLNKININANDVNVGNVVAVKKSAFEKGHFYESVGGVFYSIERDEEQQEPIQDCHPPVKQGRTVIIFPSIIIFIF